jgi:hypothetical protein
VRGLALVALASLRGHRGEARKLGDAVGSPVDGGDEKLAALIQAVMEEVPAGDLHALNVEDLWVTTFMIGDVRAGCGERDLFYRLYLNLASKFPRTATQLLRKIPTVYATWRSLNQLYEKMAKTLQLANNSTGGTGDVSEETIRVYTALCQEIVRLYADQLRRDSRVAAHHDGLRLASGAGSDDSAASAHCNSLSPALPEAAVSATSTDTSLPMSLEPSEDSPPPEASSTCISDATCASTARPAAGSTSTGTGSNNATENRSTTGAGEHGKGAGPSSTTGTGRISLAAKWAPRIGSSVDKSCGLGKAIAALLFPAHRAADADKGVAYSQMSYRRLVSSLNKQLRTVEVSMCGGDWSSIAPCSVPALAKRKYRKAFSNAGGIESDDRRALAARFLDVAETTDCPVLTGDAATVTSWAKQHIDALIRSCLIGAEDSTVEAMYSAMREDVRASFLAMTKDATGQAKLPANLMMVDTGTSMRDVPMEVALGLGILLSELSRAPWARKMLTFGNDPRFSELPAGTLHSMVRHARSMPSQLDAPDLGGGHAAYLGRVHCGGSQGGRLADPLCAHRQAIPCAG